MKMSDRRFYWYTYNYLSDLDGNPVPSRYIQSDWTLFEENIPSNGTTIMVLVADYDTWNTALSIIEPGRQEYTKEYLETTPNEKATK